VSAGTRYNKYFFHGLTSGSEASAEQVVPFVKEMLSPTSVLDIGCGTGAWLSKWMAAGVLDVIGVDGDYVDRSELLIPADRFVAHDLATPLDLGRRFDLVSTVEVAEHIPARSSATFVDTLVRHGDLVLFSAAIPGQGGTGHINEQWPSYWAELFERHGYGVYDVLRSQLWDRHGIEVWYRQNLMIFATPEAADRRALSTTDAPLDVVHPELFRSVAAGPFKVRAKQKLLDSPIGPAVRAARAKITR
jgi:SAM-dependent methyltransferase